MAATRRALHYVFKVGDRTSTIKFFREMLGMKVLRHEEFEEGCKAACNGPYDGKWSKTMVGYGPEDKHFVVELTYNYGLKHYQQGNDYQGMKISSKNCYSKLKEGACSFTEQSDGGLYVIAPGGYPFIIYNNDPSVVDPVNSVMLSVSNLAKSIDYWRTLLKMEVYSQTDSNATLGYAENQAKLVLQQISAPIDHAKAFGRIAFSCPRSELPGIESCVKESGNKILTPLVSLDTPGKATVEVVILADPDGHEICFVGDKAFRELSRVDPTADKLINDAIASDKSVEWFAKHKKQ